MASTTTNNAIEVATNTIPNSTANAARLEKVLPHRPEKHELVDRNILKDSNVAPALQAREAELKRAQIGDVIERNIQQRKRTIDGYTYIPPLPKPDESPIDADESRHKLEKSLKQRPEKDELVEKNILKNSNAAPALQAAQAELQRSQLEDKLEHALQQRPEPAELVRGHILQEDEAPPV
ncbi:uncharacterized protein EI90DRAFT_1329655 [Cantharellus anzutake]|uniref:uncharacterized protein n=1 Tax=Cantharellus anzutake TaxID=1750568 RepID=UPI0019084AD5|nr:uncharacterized protein EI90DRAFT_1329655 [Cantharellus anzutake]KAF8342311.1 hypothetical protein EI90DRAFT_1329655 [Cantharellus anzutake]